MISHQHAQVTQFLSPPYTATVLDRQKALRYYKENRALLNIWLQLNLVNASHLQSQVDQRNSWVLRSLILAPAFPTTTPQRTIDESILSVNTLILAYRSRLEAQKQEQVAHIVPLAVFSSTAGVVEDILTMQIDA